jgi:hypothetical protein
MSAVTATTFTVVGEYGIFLDTAFLTKRGRGHRAKLLAWLQAPPAIAGPPVEERNIEAELAYEHDDRSHLATSGRLVQFPKTRIIERSTWNAATATAHYPWRKHVSEWQDITKYVNRAEPLVLRVTARVTTGTGNILMATVTVESE